MNQKLRRALTSPLWIEREGIAVTSSPCSRGGRQYSKPSDAPVEGFQADGVQELCETTGR